MQIMAYTESENPDIFRTYRDAGVDYINHDYLDIALEVLAENP